jgi:hypothetical protein
VQRRPPIAPLADYGAPVRHLAHVGMVEVLQGHGVAEKEWFSLDPESGLAWLPLALDFALAGR